MERFSRVDGIQSLQIRQDRTYFDTDR
ncbi:hypothetical protein LINPERHAP1_LOCUS33683 [Linum perenne]